MLYRVIVKPSAEKEISRLPVAHELRIRDAIFALAANPFLGKKLEGEYKQYYSIRVWPYRIIYSIHKKELIVIVIRVGHRQGVY